MPSVLLVHGMGRTSVSMMLLARRFQARGYAARHFGYLVSRDPLERIADRLVDAADKHFRGRPHAIVGHSLGGVISRLACPRLESAGLDRLVMLGTPNNSPVMARTLRRNVAFRLLTGDAGQRLSTPEFFEQLPVPTVPTLVYAGTSGPRHSWLPFAGRASDGVVLVGETHLEGATHREVPGLHTFLMNDARITDEIIAFLDAGNLGER